MFYDAHRSRIIQSLLSLMLAAGVGAGLAACSDAADSQESPGPEKPTDKQPGEVRSDKQRVSNPQVSEANQAELVAGNTQFALDLHRELSAMQGNIFYSPFSVSEALAMAYAGARGDTATDIAQTLHLTLAPADLHPAFNWLDAHLMNLGTTPINEGSEAFELAVANSIWGQVDYNFEADFLDTLALNYGAGLNTLDFVSAPEPSRQIINSWVEEKTKDRIKDLLQPGTITSDTRMVLTNAIYFKASWLHPFQKEATQTGDFTRPDGSKVSAELMQQTTYLSYADLGGYKAVELPYDGGNVSMLVLLPDDLAAFEQNFTPSVLADTLAALQSERVELVLPKFEFTLSLTLSSVLREMGMLAPFGDTADFTGMSADGGLGISEILHKAFVAVDEEGTEAAAATAIVVGTTSAPPPPVQFHADKPFLFVIRANDTGSLLFVGRVADPAQ